MRLLRLYSNQPVVFEPIVFNPGFSVVLAEIRIPENRLLDTHNLGKTTVGELLDFCLLKGKSNALFLYRNAPLFDDLTFFLEIQVAEGSYLTVGRPVQPGPRVNFKRSAEPGLAGEDLLGPQWDHVNVPAERARQLLNGLLDWSVLRPWDYRKVVGYLIRSQADYQDVFQLGKFSGKHQEWKPFVAHLLGADAQPVIDLYQGREAMELVEYQLATLTAEWGGEEADPSVVDALLAVQRAAVARTQRVLESFDLGAEDGRLTTTLVEDTETSIVELNDERYRQAQQLQRVRQALSSQASRFRLQESAALFEEVGALFRRDLTKSYEDLLAFNHAITEERRQALAIQVGDLEEELARLDGELADLNRQRTAYLEFLRDSESLEKFKALSAELLTLQAKQVSLEERRSAATRLSELRRQVRTLRDDYSRLETQVEGLINAMSQDDTSRFGQIRRYFNEIVEEVLGQSAIIAISMNRAGGLDFIAEFVNDSGQATSGDRGTSYKKLLCIAFDLALLRSYLDVSFSRFVYHDGALEALDPRKREKLLTVLRRYAEFGLQPIISALDSDLPVAGTNSEVLDGDVILRLHDEGESGRLFKTATW